MRTLFLILYFVFGLSSVEVFAQEEIAGSVENQSKSTK